MRGRPLPSCRLRSGTGPHRGGAASCPFVACGGPGLSSRTPLHHDQLTAAANPRACYALAGWPILDRRHNHPATETEWLWSCRPQPGRPHDHPGHPGHQQRRPRTGLPTRPAPTRLGNAPPVPPRQVNATVGPVAPISDHSLASRTPVTSGQSLWGAERDLPHSPLRSELRTSSRTTTQTVRRQCADTGRCALTDALRQASAHRMRNDCTQRPLDMCAQAAAPPYGTVRIAQCAPPGTPVRNPAQWPRRIGCTMSPAAHHQTGPRAVQEARQERADQAIPWPSPARTGHWACTRAAASQGKRCSPTASAPATRNRPAPTAECGGNGPVHEAVSAQPYVSTHMFTAPPPIPQSRMDAHSLPSERPPSDPVYGPRTPPTLAQ